MDEREQIRQLLEKLSQLTPDEVGWADESLSLSADTATGWSWALTWPDGHEYCPGYSFASRVDALADLQAYLLLRLLDLDAD